MGARLSPTLYNRQRIAGREPADFAARIHGMDDPAVGSQYTRCRLDVRPAFMHAGVARSRVCSFRIQVVQHRELQVQPLDRSPASSSLSAESPTICVSSASNSA
jgi:hypothetical protein